MSVGPPLIGRAAELRRLSSALAETLAGEGGCVVLTGPPGMGKTSLLTAAADEARELNLATAAGRATEGDRSAPLATLRAALLRAQPHAIDLVSTGASDVGGFWYVEQIANALDEYVAQRPLAIIIDDAQWTDEFSVTALRYLIPELASSPLRWILARRPGPTDTPAQEVVEWLLENGAARIDLDPLGDDAVTQLCARVIGAEPDQTVLTLAARADGNPFLLEQLIDTLRRDGQIVISSAGVATVVGDELPSGFLSAVDQRLRGLAPMTRRLLQAGAVLGRPFSIAAAAGVLGVTVTELLLCADEAVQSTILSEKDAELVFRHDLLREAVYNNISGPVRAAMHLQAAAVLRGEGRSAMEVADHLLRSGPTNDEQAVAELRAAAAQAADRAPGSAATFVIRALQLVGEHDPVRPQLCADAVGLLASAGRLVEAREVAEAAMRGGLDAPTEGIVLLGLAEATKHAGQNPLAAQYARRALAIEAVPGPIRAKLHAILAHSLMYGGDLKLADEAGAEAQRIGERSGEYSAAVFGLVARSVVARTEGRLADSLGHARTAVELTDRSGGTVRHRHPRIWLGNALAATDRFDEAVATYREGLREAEDLGTAWSLPLFHFVWASLLFWRADLDAAVAEAEAGLRVAEQLTARQLSVPILGLLVRIAVARDDLDLARSQLGRMKRRLAEGVTAPPEDVAWTFGTYYEATEGPRPAFDELAKLYDGLPDRILLLTHDPGAAAVLVRVALGAGDRERAAVVVAAARRMAQRNPGVASLAAGAAHAAGLLDGDLTALRSAVELYQDSPRVLARAGALEDTAAAEAIAGHQRRANELLEAALLEYQTRGVLRAVRRLEGDASARVPAPRSAAGRTGLALLTRAELAVARLVGEGMSNRAAAEALYLSPHTVDSHLRHIFAKLGFNRRVELVRFMLGVEGGGEIT